MVELGKSVGINPRFDIPFEGGHAIMRFLDARHQVKYVSAIWQRLTKTDFRFSLTASYSMYRCSWRHRSYVCRNSFSAKSGWLKRD